MTQTTHTPAEQAAANFTASEVVGYRFSGGIYCPCCMIAALPTGPGDAFEGWALAKGVPMRPEANLDEIAFAFGFNRADQTTFDSQDFPHVLLQSEVDALDDDPTMGGCYYTRCCACQEDLGD